MTTDTIIYMADVEKLTHLSRPTIDKYIKEKNFPKPSRIGPKKAWYKSTVINWLNVQMEKGIGNSE